MNNIKPFLLKSKENPKSIDFQEVILIIDANYNFIPTVFKNGDQINNLGENNGSCKLFAFAKMQNLNKEETLALFGNYYFEDVLQNPTGTDHQNIRNFMIYDWNGIEFEENPLTPKS